MNPGKWMTTSIVTTTIGALALAPWLGPGASLAAETRGAAQTTGFPALEALERDLSRLVETARPSVVGVIARSPLEDLLDSLGEHITIEDLDAGHRGPLAKRVGSGIVIDAKGHIVTLASVVSGASDVVILSPDLRRLQATVAGVDDYSGLAVLEAVNGERSLTPVSFAEPGSVRDGSLVITLSSPAGESGGAPVYAVGLVSGLGVSPGPVRRGPYIKLNAPSAPGAGGGAVLDTKGRLVGIVFGADGPPMGGHGPIRWEERRSRGKGGLRTFQVQVPDEEEPEPPDAAAAPDAATAPDLSISALEALHRAGVAGGGVTYAVPGDVVRHVADEILRSGSVRRGWVGVKIEEAEPGEVRLLSVVPGSPAEKAGLRPGDRIVSFGLGPSPEEPLAGSAFLVDRIASSTPGAVMKLGVVRGETRMKVALVLGEAPETSSPRVGHGLRLTLQRMRPPVLGVEIDQEIDDAARARLGAPAGVGLLVLKVHDASRALQAGMKQGDLIIEALGNELRTLADLHRALHEQGDREMIVKVIRDRRELTLDVPPPPSDLPPPEAPPPPPPAPRRPARPGSTP